MKADLTSTGVTAGLAMVKEPVFVNLYKEQIILFVGGCFWYCVLNVFSVHHD